MFTLNIILVSILMLLIFTHLIINSKSAIKGFQQNAYMPKNYRLWYKDNLYKIFANYWLLLFVIFILYLLKLNIIVNILSVITIIILIFSIIFKNKLNKLNERIKLVYTPRVKRLIGTYILLLLLVSICTFVSYLYLVTKKDNVYLLMILNLQFVFINILLPFFIIIANFINKPIEKYIRNGFINEAKQIIQSYNGEVIALTGSYGKTTTKNYVNTILSESKFVYQTPASYNSTMGITISIRENLKNIHDIFLVELGAKENNDLDDVMDITNPDVAVLSSIGPQHLLSFKTIDNVINTKFSIVEQLKPNGKAYINYDNEYIRNYDIKNKDVEIIKYGVENKDANYSIENIEQGIKGTKFDVYHNGTKINENKFETSVLGALNLLNICVSIAIANDKNIPMRKIALGVKKIIAPDHRLQIKNNSNYIMIDDAYNSNPVGSKEALNVLSKFNGRRIIVTPGMIELGDEQERLNKEFGKYMINKTDYIILTGTKITPPIYEGIKESGYDMNNVYNVNHISEAFAMLNNLCKNDKENYVLFENDLPDVFM